MTTFVFSTLVTTGHQITKFYYIKFFGHEVTNFNAPQKPTYIEKSRTEYSVLEQPLRCGPRGWEKKAPFLGETKSYKQRNGNITKKFGNHCHNAFSLESSHKGRVQVC